MPTVDLAIIGAGPAGLATAMSLINLDPGWRDRLIVLEKDVHPRHKLCGGGLSPLALENLKRLGLRLRIPHVPTRQARFEYKDRRVMLDGDPAIVLTRRQEFDAWLAGEAQSRGVRLLQNTPVEALRLLPHGLELGTAGPTYLAQAVVGADGSKGRVRRWLDAREQPPKVARLLEFNTPSSGDEPEYTEAFARFDFTPSAGGLQGYYWDFPSVIEGAPSMNRGLYDSRASASRPKANLPHLLRREAQRHGVPEADVYFEGHPIHWFSPRNRFSGKRAVLVGDALGAEPLFGEGIGIALGHSQVAAEALHEAFQRRIFEFSDYRRRILTSYVGRYATLRWAVAAILYRFSGSEGFMHFTWSVANLTRRVLGSLDPVPGVLDPSFELSTRSAL